MNTLRIDKTNVDKIIEELKEKGEVISMISDPIFKSILMDEEMKGILSFIISEVTGLNEKYVYENLEYRNSYLKKQNITHKDNTADLIVDIEKNVIMLEMNAENTMYNRFRNVAHFHSQIVNSILVSKRREEVGQIFQINFDVKRAYTNKLISKIMMKDEDNQVDEDEISFQKYKVNLSFLEKKRYNIDELTRFEKLLLIMKEDRKKELYELAKGDKELEKMVKKVEKMSMDPKYVSLYDEERLDELARDFDRKEAREEGIEQGISQGIKQTAKKLLEAKVDINVIMDSTGLTKEEIEKL